MKSILERLHVCYLVLTSHSYYTFFLSKNKKVRGSFIENPGIDIDNAIAYYLTSDIYLTESYKQSKAE